MPINFHNKKHRFEYTERYADSSWRERMLRLLDPKGKHVLDIGCGGGIYTRAWAQLEALSVLGIDFSEDMIQTARDYSTNFPNVSYKVGNALSTGLEDQSYDIVFERALIHHLSDLSGCFKEAFRLLKPGGKYIIQDRTPTDVTIPGSEEHIRGYFFEKYPFLLEIEMKRRHSSSEVEEKLSKTGFINIHSFSFWEIRKIYQNVNELKADILERTGRSILYELNDEQLCELVNYISLKISSIDSVREKDRWTIWTSIR